MPLRSARSAICLILSVYLGRMHDRKLNRARRQLWSQSVIDIWQVDLREVGREPLQLLSAGERARAARIVNPARRALWMRGRGVLRMLLGGYLQRPAGELALVVGEHGKPALVDSPSDSPPLCFNLSHSGPLAVYAFTCATPVGIDLEVERERALHESALAERIFGVEAAQRLRGLDPSLRRQEFLRMWVRHEAALKCLGKGLAGAGGGNEADTEGLWVAGLDLGPELAGAVAVLGGPRELRCWDWPPQPE